MAGEVTRVVDEQLKVCDFCDLGNDAVMPSLCVIAFHAVAACMS